MSFIYRNRSPGGVLDEITEYQYQNSSKNLVNLENPVNPVNPVKEFPVRVNGYDISKRRL